jgi:hypothetical protein
MGVVALVIFVILFSTFGSVRQALLIIINVPTTLVGAIIALLVMGETPERLVDDRPDRALRHLRPERRRAGGQDQRPRRRAGMTLREAVIEGRCSSSGPS